MPVLESPRYTPPFYARNRHVQTIVPVALRKIPEITYTRQELSTPDGDFIHVDWVRQGNSGLAVIAHGMESSSRSHNVMGLARTLVGSGWDIAALNARGCSGVVNRLPRYYHAGATEDLSFLIDHIIREGPYANIALAGFSLGGNMVFKYLGEQGSSIPAKVKAAAGVSVPLNLESCARKLAQPRNRFYMNRFLQSYYKKLKLKARLFPDIIDVDGYSRIRTFEELDNRYTAPLHGFEDAADYWHRASAAGYLDSITIPTLLINSRDDPFLTPDCFPEEAARENPNLFVLFPGRGGHCGFMESRLFTLRGPWRVCADYWHETVIRDFFDRDQSA
jgi:hypothetical protein